MLDLSNYTDVRLKVVETKYSWNHAEEVQRYLPGGTWENLYGPIISMDHYASDKQCYTTITFGKRKDNSLQGLIR